MYTKWTQHLRDPQEKENFQHSILSAKSVLRRLTDILNDGLKELNKTELSEAVFSDPNWAYKQAYYNGQKACLGHMTRLLDLDQQETK